MSGGGKQTFLTAYMNYTKIKSANSKGMGSFDSKVDMDHTSSPAVHEVKSGFQQTTKEQDHKFHNYAKLLKSPQSQDQKCKAWLVDNESTVPKISVKSLVVSDKNMDVKAKTAKGPINESVHRSPVHNKTAPVPEKSPRVQPSRLSLDELQSSPSQNLRQRLNKEDASHSCSKKARSRRGIRFSNSDIKEVRRDPRLRKRKQPEKTSDLDSDSEVSFKPKRRRIEKMCTKRMPPSRQGSKHENSIKGLRQTIAEKRASKRKEKQAKLNTLRKLDSPSRHTRGHDSPRSSARKRDSPRSSIRGQESPRSLTRTVADKTLKSLHENFASNGLRRDLRKRLTSPLKKKRRLNSPLKDKNSENIRERKRRKLTSQIIRGRRNPRRNENSVKTKQRVSHLQKIDRLSPTRTSPRAKLKQASCYESPSSHKKSTVSSSPQAGPVRHSHTCRLSVSPRSNGLPTVLSLNTISGTPHKIQDNSFSSPSPGFSATAISGSDQSPSTAAPSTSESAYFQSPPRPVSLSLDHTSDSSYPQVVNTNTSNHAALDYLLPNSGTCLSGAQTEKSNSGTFLSGAETEKANSGTCLSGAETEKSNSGTFLSGTETEKAPPFTEIKTKMTLAETVDILRQAPNLNGVSVLKNNSLHKKSSLTPSDDRSSRNSSRSVTPNVTPIKSEVLTPSCTPCSTPKKSPSCSPAPSLDHVAVAQVKRKQKYLFCLHQEVLAQWMDGLYYLGTILKIEEKNQRCLLKYEDNSKYWSMFKDIHRNAKVGEMVCCVCLGEDSDKPNEIVLCDNCGQGYHQNCHTPVVGGSEILDPDDEWCCRKCIFAFTTKAGGALNEGKYAKELKKLKLTFPYDTSTLTWDAQHKTNVEQYYCYCGGPGIWYQKMLQCCRCKQWFHEACIQCLQYPLLFADSFYIFVCTCCNFGQEYIKRLSIDWPDLVHIAIFNLTMERNQKYYELDDDIMTWIDDSWDWLQVQEYNKLEYMERKNLVEEALRKNTKRFINGNEIKKSRDLWGLRIRVPPPRTHITLPVEKRVNDDVMQTLKVKGRRSKVFVPVPCESPVKMGQSPLQLKRVARHKLLQNSPLISQDGPQPPEESADESFSERKGPQGPLLERLIPPSHSYHGHNHPFKLEIEVEREKIESHQRSLVWQSFNPTEKYQSQLTDDDSASVALDGPPVLVKEEPVEMMDMSPPLSEISETSSIRGRGRKSNTPKLNQSAGLKRSKRLSFQKHSRNSPPDLEQNLPVKYEISVKKVKRAKANYLCAFDKLGYAKGLYVLGKRESETGTMDYMVSWE